MDDFDWTKHVTFEDDEARLDHIAAIVALTNTSVKDWVVAEGPDSGVGETYWYVHQQRNLTAYVTNDQQHISIEVTEDGGDSIVRTEFDLNELVSS